RDSEGRVRRETADQVTIWDPVANTSYVLDPKAQTARQLPLAKQFFTSGKFVTAARAVGPEAGFALVTAEGPQQGGKTMAFNTGPGSKGGRGGFSYSFQTGDGKPESLGEQIIEGIKAQGTRITSTIPAGAIGNDRPIQTISEHWDSPELQTTIKNMHSDPRMGDQSFRLTNISRVEPAPYLFQIPPDYQRIGSK